MKRWKGAEGAIHVPAAADVMASEARAAGSYRHQAIGRTVDRGLLRVSAKPARVLGTMWPLDRLADIGHVKG